MKSLAQWGLALAFLMLVANLPVAWTDQQTKEDVVKDFPEYACALSFEELTAVVQLARPMNNDGGSGFVIADGWVLTAKHVLEPRTPAEFWVVIINGEPRAATEQWLHPTQDIALLRVDTSGTKPLQLATSDPYAYQKVLAAGYPGGYDIIVTEGHVQYKTPQGVGEVIPALVTTAPASPGNSGGPLVTCGGRVVGVLNGIAYTKTSHGVQLVYHITIATPLETVVAFLQERGIDASQEENSG